PVANNRIEEHGLHIWLGFYENAFQIMRRCYEELGRPKGSPLASWTDAFKPHDFVAIEEFINNEWLHWPVVFPSNASLPGDAQPLPTLWDYVAMGLEWIDSAFRDYSSVGSLPNEALKLPHTPLWLKPLLDAAVHALKHQGLNLGAQLLRMARQKAEALSRN